MINMMYLVLTAILCLNVSAEILQAFESLRSSLEVTANSHGAQNSSLATDILKTIESQESQGTTKYSYVKQVVSDINQETADMIAYLSGITGELEDIAGINEETGEYERKDEQEDNYRFWMGGDDLANSGHGRGKAFELREKLSDFVTWANEMHQRYQPDYSGIRFEPLVLEPKNDPAVTNPDSKNKTWEYLSFHNKPVIADMAMIKKFEMDIRDVQTGLLNMSKNLINDFTFTVDSLIGFEAPRAQVVAAGMKYETTIGVGVASKSIKPEFVGSGLSLDPGGSTATMTITANGNVIPAGKTEGIQRYSAMIKVPRADGELQEIPIQGEFKVRKPEVVVRSKALQILYKDCGNTVEVDVPALGDLYNPDFSRSTGGKVLKSNANRKEITIVPNRPKFDLSVYTKTNGQNVKLDKLTYNVVRPPIPRLVLLVNGREHNLAAPISKRGAVTVKLVPDSEFKKTLPRDARYKASKIKLMIQDGIGPPRTVKTYSGADIQRGVRIQLAQGAIRNAYPGAKIYFEVEGIKRVNFENRAIEITRMPRTQRFLSAIIKG